MTRLIIAQDAERDISNILTYLEQRAGALVAQEYGVSIRRALLRLTEFRDIGAPRPVLGAHIGVALLYPYLLIYEHVPGAAELTLLRVIHGAANITAEILMR